MPEPFASPAPEKLDTALEVRKLRTSVDNLAADIRELQKRIGGAEVKVQIHDERSQHAVTWGKLGVAFLVMILSVLAGVWKLTEDSVHKNADYTREARAELVTRMNSVEQSFDQAYATMLRREAETRKAGGRR